jgi:hypothetical protein
MKVSGVMSRTDDKPRVHAMAPAPNEKKFETLFAKKHP